ncbi:MAG: phosphoribosylformylglycinamidine synthase subunit PurL [Candidatus Hatepunaea meridiana]|nr:phosphoribosylformylglycinamidine synthase subunit PurL [Candidatus Hatepunaea meridiana]
MTIHNPLRPATVEEAKAQAMNEEEFQRVAEILGRIPNVTELAIFASMWSEHASYKNSILELKTLPRSGGRLLVDAGEENAGMVDIGDGLAVVFKIESHNHPSAVEPFQGAATGVGGILRDVFTMGARPLVALNSLHFGNLDDPHNRFLLDGVVRGIAHYGNCFGVPTAAGEVIFDPAYTGNPLVNAMAVGILKVDKLMRARAEGIGNPVFYIGSRTGRDGMHGATFASEELSEDNEAKRPAVQVGDPFAEKLLLEATLELADTGAVVAIQDMGAAGLTCSSSEMAAAGGVGMDINLDLVPLREDEMEPWEIMLSESQERMLLVAKKGQEHKILEVLEKWELEAARIGEVTDSGRLRIYQKGFEVADVPAWDLALGGGAPQYKREYKRPVELDELEAFDPLSLPEPDDPGQSLLTLLASPDIASKEWIYEQYDQSVRTNTALEPGFGDAAVIRVEGTNKGLAVKTDGNARYVSLNPRRGAMLAVAESARNVACTGARPVAVTNCLNFGHPYKPEIYYFFHEAVAGMGEACRALDTPVTGGNVSFYNETHGQAVLPTPVIGMLGVMDDVSKNVGSFFTQSGDDVYLLGEILDYGLGGSSYLKVFHNKTAGKIPLVNFDNERRLIDLLVGLVEGGLINSAHDVSDGGLAVTLAECCISNKRTKSGVVIDYPIERSLKEHLFSESPGRVVVSVNRKDIDLFVKRAENHGVPYKKIGITGGDRYIWKGMFNLPIEKLADAYYNAISRLMNRE